MYMGIRSYEAWFCWDVAYLADRLSTIDSFLVVRNTHALFMGVLLY